MKLSTVAAGFINGAVAAGIIAVGVTQSNEAAAQERLQGISEQDKHCLSLNVYHEARGETIAGQVAVAWVTHSIEWSHLISPTQSVVWCIKHVLTQMAIRCVTNVSSHGTAMVVQIVFAINASGKMYS